MGKLDKRNIEDILSLTPMQEGMLFHYLKDPASEHYFEQLNLRIKGEMNCKLFEEAWNLVIETNEMLRVVFRWEKLENPIQIILKKHKLPPVYHGFDESDDRARDRQDRFDLQEVPFRVTLFQVAAGEYELIISNHHILYDGWSLGIILGEFFSAYDDLSRGRRPRVPSKPPYKEYLKWLQARDKEGEKRYWQAYLSGLAAPMKLTLNRAGSKDISRASHFKFNLSPELSRRLESFAREQRFSTAVLFYTAWGILLHRCSMGEEVVFGTTVSGRRGNIKGIQDMVGLFINTLPLRMRIYGQEEAGALLERINQSVQAREEYEVTPLVDIMSCSPLAQSEALFDTLVVIENYPLEKSLKDQGSTLKVESYSTFEMTNYDLTLAITPGEQVQIDLLYNQAAFENEDIHRLSGYYVNILQDLVANPGKKIQDVEMLSSEEQQLLLEFNRRGRDHAVDKTISNLFADQVSRTPDHIALVGRNAVHQALDPGGLGKSLSSHRLSLTYKQLDEEAELLARHLFEKGIQARELVAIMVDRTVEMVIGILGILKTGCGYVPLNPEAPWKRNRYILQECSIRTLLTSRDLREEVEQLRSPAINVLSIQECRGKAEAVRSAPEMATGHWPLAADIAYVIFTSGSTGDPKGVPITHANFCPLMHWGYQHMGLGPQDRVVQNLAYYFDWSVWEIFITLTSGASLYMLETEVILNPEAYADFINKNKITVLHITPSQFQSLTHSGQGLRSLEQLAIGAEKLTLDLVLRSYKLVNEKCRVYNMYGPTEATIMSAVLDIKREKEGYYGKLSSLPIGIPISNLELLVLDRDLNLCAINVPGELYMGGDGVAQGYLNNPGLSAEKFIDAGEYAHLESNNYPTNKTFYRSGDVVRWLDDGTVEFLGRVDEQVKIRGFRIEPGEIENQLLKHQAVKEAVVMTRQYENGENYLCAYIAVQCSGASNAADFREYLSHSLPDYMIPAYFVFIDKIPLNPNGKVDLKALPEPEIGERGREYAAPRNELETRLVEIWADVLDMGPAPIGIDDNFFKCGGHSLKEARLLARIHKEFDVEIPIGEIFRLPTIRGLSSYIIQKERRRYVGLVHAEDKEYYPLSPAQGRLFILQQMGDGGKVYNMPGIMMVQGELEKEKLQQFFTKMIQRHESFRTSFPVIDEQPVQKILHPEEVTSEIEFYRAGQSPASGSVPLVMQYADIIQRFIRPFVLSFAPLLRLGLINIEEGKHILMLDMHHIISDGSSIEIFRKEFVSFFKGEESPAARFQYRDYCEWLSHRQQDEAVKQQEAFWLKEFAGEIPVLDLPIDFPRPPVQSFSGRRLSFEINEAGTAGLRALAFQENATLYMVLLAVFNVFLAKLSGQEDIVIGTPTPGRNHLDLARVIGMFVNTLALRNYPSGEKRFLDFVQEVRARTTKAFENQDFQFEDLVERVSINRDASRNPLFDMVFAMQDISEPEIEIPGLSVTPLDYHIGVSKFDLTLSCELMSRGGVQAQALGFTVEYCTSLFMEETIQRFISYFKKIVTEVIKQRDIRIGEIEILPAEEKRQILYDFNHTGEAWPVYRTIPQLFSDQVLRNPDNTALVFAGEKLTYGELDEKSSLLADFLFKQGVREGDLLGIMLERSFEMIIGMLSILKAGSGYVPLNIKAPVSRNRYIMAECSIKFLLIARDIQEQTILKEEIEYFEFEYKALHHNAAALKSPTGGQPVISSGTTAYVIFTSGSTGKPKGVPITHANLSPLLHWGYRELGIGLGDRTIQNLSYYFDWSVWEIFITLTSGASLYMIPDEKLLNPGVCIDFITANEITILHITPSQYQYIVSQGIKLGTLRYLFIGAEKLTYDLLECSLASVGEGCRVFNMYGPTETTIIAAVLEIDRQEYAKYKRLSSVPIGTPAAELQLLVLDKNLQLCPVNRPGELYIAGDGLAAGYLNEQEHSSQVFIKNAYETEGIRGERLYRTGDLVRWLPDGSIEFLGRTDYQVKIRGFRIEPGEIEKRLLAHEAVKEAVVADLETGKGEKYLCAFIVAKRSGQSKGRLEWMNGTPPSSEVLREYLSETLPDYMIPAYFVSLDSIPLNPNGKVNRKALPVPDLEGPGVKYIPPRNEFEEKLVEIWSEVLDIDPGSVGIDTSFFELGGQSLKATVLAAKINKELNIKLKLTEIFKMPTIRGLSSHLESAVADRLLAIENAEEKEYYPLSSAQRRLYILQQIEKNSMTYNMPRLMVLEGKPETHRLERTFCRLIERHESFRTSFEMVAGKPVQKIHRPGDIEFTIEFCDSSKSTASESPQAVGSVMIQDFLRPFDLAHAPLLRLGLVKLMEEKFVLMLDMHHIISDGTSVGIFIRDFMAIYGGRELFPLHLQYRYKDFSEWQDSKRWREAVAGQEQYWLDQFAGPVPEMKLTYDDTRSLPRSFEGNSLEFELDRETTRALKQLAREEGATLFMVLLAVYYVLLMKLSWREDIVVGTTVMGRRFADMQNIIGMFVNTLALRNYPSGQKSFTAFLKEIKERTLAAFENQDYPFEDLAEKVDPGRESSRNPLFDTLFTLQNIDIPEAEIPGLKLSPYEYKHRFSRFDMSWICIEKEGGLGVTVEYSTRLFTEERIKNFTHYFKEIIAAVLADKDIRLMDIDVYSGLVDSEKAISEEAYGDFGF